MHHAIKLDQAIMHDHGWVEMRHAYLKAKNLCINSNDKLTMVAQMTNFVRRAMNMTRKHSAKRLLRVDSAEMVWKQD